MFRGLVRSQEDFCKKLLKNFCYFVQILDQKPRNYQSRKSPTEKESYWSIKPEVTMDRIGYDFHGPNTVLNYNVFAKKL